MYPNPASRSAELYKQALAVMPGGNTRYTVYFPPYPIYAQSGAGCMVRDVDGREYVDFINNASASIHGHCHPHIVAAVQTQAAKLLSVCLPTELEIELAQLISNRVPSLERLRFCSSGSEAVMFALKAARAYTGQPKIAKIEGAYHGAYDVAEASMDPTANACGDPARPKPVAYSAGTPAGVLSDVVVLPLNNTEASLALLEENRAHLAAVLVDPLVSRMAYAPATREYLMALREFCDASKALLVFDEVYSFRMGYGGAQGEVGVTPDLTALGKIIGGGLSIGAFGGKAEYMSVFDQRAGRPRAPHGGTFNGNPLAMAAGLAAMQMLTRDVFAELARLGARLRQHIDDAFAVAGWEGKAYGCASMASVRLSSAPFRDYRGFISTNAAQASFPLIHRHLLNLGVLVMSSGNLLISTPMRDAEIDRFAEAFLSALRALPREHAA